MREGHPGCSSEPHGRGALARERGRCSGAATRPGSTGIPNGPRPPPGWFPEPEDARASTPGSNPGRAGRALTIRGGNGSHTSHPGSPGGCFGAQRESSAQDRSWPHKTGISSPQGGTPPPAQFTAGRRQGPTTAPFGWQNPGLAHPLPLAGHGSLPSESGSPRRPESSPGSRASSGGGHHRETKSRGYPLRVRRQKTPNTCGDVNNGIDLRLRRSGPLPGADPAGHSLRPQPNRETFPLSFFGWSSLRGLAPAPRIRRTGQGCRTVCWRVLMALTGRARYLAERLVDGLGLFTPRGPRSRAFDVPGE